MAAFAIMRMEKIKSSGSLKRALEHNTRERMPENADPKRLSFNKYEGGSVDDVMSRYIERLPDKVRKNAVLAVELVMTASADFKGNWNDYLNDCGKWAKKLFGADNVLSVAHHLDEKTPHVQIIVQPLKDGKLNAKHFIGGSRDRMAELQDEFFKEVGFLHGLSRGQSRQETKARHSHPSAAVLDEREQKILEAEKIIKKAVGISPAEIGALRTYKANWEKTTPAGLRVIAADIERSKCATVGEYSAQVQAQKQQQKEQGYKTSR